MGPLLSHSIFNLTGQIRGLTLLDIFEISKIFLQQMTLKPKFSSKDEKGHDIIARDIYPRTDGKT